MSALDVVQAGKHSGSTYAAVAETDRGYCHWIVNATALPRSLRPFRTWLRRTHGGVLGFGKHKNVFYSEIYTDQPDYTIWACQISDASGALRDFQEYCFNAMRRSQAKRPLRRGSRWLGKEHAGRGSVSQQLRRISHSSARSATTGPSKCCFFLASIWSLVRFAARSVPHARCVGHL